MGARQSSMFKYTHRHRAYKNIAKNTDVTFLHQPSGFMHKATYYGRELLPTGWHYRLGGKYETSKLYDCAEVDLIFWVKQ